MKKKSLTSLVQQLFFIDAYGFKYLVNIQLFTTLSIHPRKIGATLAVILMTAWSGGNAAVYPEIVIESDSGIVLHEVDANQSWYPASLTKMMTLYLTFSALKSKKLALKEKLKVSTHAAIQPATRLGLNKNESISVDTAISSVATISANDVAVVLAERLAGSEKAFARQMNIQARKLGMNSTVFRNASGLPDSLQKTTARDMAILGFRLKQDFPEFFHYFSKRTFTYKGRRRSRTNGLIGSYKGTDGIKTGFTCASGYNLVTSTQRQGIGLIGVILGSNSNANRNRRMVQLLDAGFSKAQKGISGKRIGELASGNGDQQEPPVRFSPEQCGRYSGKSVLTGGKLPGWGILLGIYTSRKEAESIAKKARSGLKSITRNSRTAILQRKFERGTSWKVLLVGMQKKDVGKACKHLWAQGMNCVSQPPQIMAQQGFAKL